MTSCAPTLSTFARSATHAAGVGALADFARPSVRSPIGGSAGVTWTEGSGPSLPWTASNGVLPQGCRTPGGAAPGPLFVARWGCGPGTSLTTLYGVSVRRSLSTRGAYAAPA